MSTVSELKSRILAHRGLNPSADERNYRSLSAIERAFSRGFGVEVDVTSNNGKVVLAHDPPEAEFETKEMSELVRILRREWKDQILALNIKSSGLAMHMPKIEQRHFFFDNAVPDLINFYKKNMPVAARISEYEILPPIHLMRSDVIWLDSFISDWFLSKTKSSEFAPEILAIPGLKVFVSPELHRRPKGEMWAALQKVFAKRNDVAICTDEPEQFFESLNVA